MFNSPISTNRFHHSPNSPFTHPFTQNPQPSAFTSSPSVPNLDNIDELPLPTKLTKASSSNHTGLSTRESSIDVIKQRSRKESFENDGFFSPCFSKEFEPSMSFDDEEIQLKRLPALKASDFEVILDVIPRNLIMSSETSLVYPCYASLRLKQDLYVEKPGLDILLILDIKDHEISSIINIMQNVLPHLSEHDRLALFTTQGTCAKRLPFKVMDEPSKSTFINECYAIKELGGRSRNSLKNVLQTSLEAVKNRKYENHLAAIFLISDSAEEIALDQIIQKDIFTPQQPIIYAFGLGQKHHPVNLAQVCEHFEGAYSYAENFHVLEKAFKNRISQLGDIQARNIKIKIQTNPFQLTKIYDKNTINEESTQYYETQRNYLSLRKGVDLALEIQVPKWTQPISEIQHCPSSIRLDFSCENLFHSGEISVQYTREFDIKIVPCFEHEISKKQVDLKSLEKFCEVKMLVRYFQVVMMMNYGLVGHGIQVLNGLKTDLSAFTKFGGVQIKQIMKTIEWTIEGLDSSRLKSRDMLMLIQHIIY